MPRFDGTGPQGMGSMTGRGLGNCTGTVDINSNYFGAGRGIIRGIGRGFRKGVGMCIGRSGYGFRNGGYNNIPEINEKDYLDQRKKELEQELAEIQRKMENKDK